MLKLYPEELRKCHVINIPGIRFVVPRRMVSWELDHFSDE